MNVNIFVSIQTLTLFISCSALFLLLRRDTKLQQRQLLTVLFASTIGNLGLFLELIAQGNIQAMYAGRIVSIFGISMYLLSLVVLASYVCMIHVPVWYYALLFVLDWMLMFFATFNRTSHLFYTSTTMMDYKGCTYLSATLGPVGYIFWIVAIVSPLLCCSFLHIKAAMRNAENRREFIIFLLFFIGPIILLLLHKLELFLPIYNLGMPVSSYICLYLFFAKWKYLGIDVVAAAAETAIDSISAGVITLTPYRELIYYNEIAKQAVGDLEKYIGKDVSELIEEIIPNMKSGETAEVSHDGKRFYVNMSDILDDAGELRGYAIMFNDMTEMFDLMEQIKEERERADEASKVKSQFLTNISHEIRTPMNAIMGLSDLIIEESRGRKVYDMAVTIRHAANSLLDLVNNILDFSNLAGGRIALQENEYSLQALVLETMKVMEVPAAQNGLSLKCNIDNNLPCMLYGDESKIRQCLLNLISNGIKFTDEGYVRLDVSGIRRDDKVTLTFMVIDTGVGIKDEDVDRLFGAFEQVDLIANKTKEGSGLGLSITKQLVELMGGIVDVSSIYGAGTTFSIRLSQRIVNDKPIGEVEEIVENAVEVLRLFVAPGIKVLLVDDNKVNLMVAKGFLIPYMLQIDTASSGEEAIEMAKEKDYNIILMDHMMPGIDGVEATRIIRKIYENRENKPFYVALTANAMGNVEEMFLSHGFDDYLSKPIEKTKLHGVLLKAVPDELRTFIETEIVEEEYTEDEMAELFMEGVDVRGAFKNRGCKQEEYVEVIELFALEGEEKYQAIKDAYVTKDWKNYCIHTHGLKSAAINIGAVNLSDKAKRHEFASKDENDLNLEFIDGDIDTLLNDYMAIIDEIKRVVEKYKANHVKIKEMDKPVIDNEKLKMMVRKTIELSESFKTKEAAEIVEELLIHELEPNVEKMLSDVRMRYKLYDDDAAEDLLHKLEDML